MRKNSDGMLQIMKEKKEKLIMPGFTQFGGKHCQTTALKNVLAMMVAFAWHPLTPFRIAPVFIQGTLLGYLLYISQ